MIFVFKLVSLGSLSAAQSGPAATEAARPSATSSTSLADHSIGVNTIEWPLMQ